MISKTSCKNDKPVNIYTYVESNRNIQLVMQTTTAEKATVTVTDLSGRIVFKKVVNVADGFNQFTVPAQTFSQGMYMITLQGELNSYSDKIIIR